MNNYASYFEWLVPTGANSNSSIDGYALTSFNNTLVSTLRQTYITKKVNSKQQSPCLQEIN